jgi:hypothetical protein
MFNDKTGYYTVLLLSMAAAFWLGYFITQLIRGSSLSPALITGAIVAALIVGVGVFYFIVKHRHGTREIPCNIINTQNIKVNNYHFIMATSKRKSRMAIVRSTDHVNGIAVETVNVDTMPHRIKIEVRLNEDPDQIADKDMVINTGATVQVTLPFPEMFRLADISSVDIRVRQV